MQLLITEMSLALTLSALVSASICGLIIAASRDVPRLSGRIDDIDALQSAHRRLTPRVGGLGIFAGLCSGLWIYRQSVGDNEVTIWFAILAGPILLTIVALIEDLGFRIRARGRLIATLAASCIMGFSLDMWLPGLGLGYLDTYLSAPWLAIPITLFVTAALAHGFNLIDGVNGLSSGVGAVGAISCSFIALQVDAYEVAAISFILGASILGFLVFNFPFGWIFLGDTGAYLIGFTAAWLGIALINHEGQITPWAVVLIFFWPLADVLFAVIRRGCKGQSLFEPDKLHLHTIVLRLLSAFKPTADLNVRWRNPLATLVLLPFFIAPPIVGVLVYDNHVIAFAAVCSFTLVYGLGSILARPFLARIRTLFHRNLATKKS